MVIGLRATFMPPGTMHRAVGVFECAVCSAVYETNTPTAMVITDYPAGSYPICDTCIESNDDVWRIIIEMLKRVIGERLPVH